MATPKADLHDGAVGDQAAGDLAPGSEPAETEKADSDGASLFSMDDLRARLDAPLFHRDQGLTTLPRLRELNFDPVVNDKVVNDKVVNDKVVNDKVVNDKAAEAPAPLPKVEAQETAAPTAVAETPAAAEPAPAPAPAAVELAPEPEPPAPKPATPPARPTLVSFSDMLSATSQAQPAPQLAQQQPEPQLAPAPEARQPEPQAQPQLVQPQLERLPERQPERQPSPQESTDTADLGAPETEALLAVLAGFGSTTPGSTLAGEPELPTLGSVASGTNTTGTNTIGTNTTGTNTTMGQKKSVEAELNRLAFLPDQEEPVGRVVVPVIAHTEQHQVIAVPQLSQHEMYTPKSIAMPAGNRATFDAAIANSMKAKRQSKGIVKRAFSLILVLGLLGAGLYAAKFYLLDPKWDPAVREYVAAVEEARHIEFDHAVDVTSLTSDQYATRLANYSLGISGSNHDLVAGELRALGLLSGALDIRSIGLAAVPETPAFYDFGAEEIFIVSGLPPATYRFAMHRALATALLDQKYGWGSRIHDASPTVIRGTRALYEADALATASAMLTPEDRALVITQRLEMYTTYSVLTTPAQFGTAVAGHLGVSLRAFIESVPEVDREAVLKGASITDGQALDLRRLVSGIADGVQQEVLRHEVLQEGARSQGMLFWYHALASRLDSATAWNAALAIQLDDVVVTSQATGYCVAALLTVTPSALDSVNGTFLAWAAAAPFESATTVVASLADGIARLSVNACDPGVGIATNNGLPPLSMGGAPLRSEQYRLLLAVNPALLRSQAACAVYFSDNITANDERLIVDPVEGWSAPAAHSAPDPNRPECAAV